ncbi:MAG: DUF4387 family protein [Acidimicrobiales bacterium]
MQLRDVTRVLRSKNAGPFLICVDLMFSSLEDLESVEASGALSPARVASAYGIRPDQVLGPFFDRRACGAKVTLPKVRSAQDPFCPDLFGCNQHVPIALMEIDR